MVVGCGTLHIVIFLSLLLQLVNSVKKDESFTISDVDRELNDMRNKIRILEASEGRYVEKSQQWGIYAIFLQVKDARYHVSGGQVLKTETLDAFRKALHYVDLASDPRLVKLRVSLNHRMGMLLRMMGKGEEAIISHKIVMEHSTHSYDRAIGAFNAGEALYLIGRVSEAIEYYRMAVDIRPDFEMIYMMIVKAMRELDEASEKDYEVLLKEMLKVQKYNLKHPHAVEDDQLAFTYMPSASGSEMHWAIFEVAEKLKRYDLAWSHLKQAHILEKEKHIPFNITESFKKRTAITSVFTEGFWPSPAVGLDSMVPVFIVGMMRSGSTLTETMLDAHGEIWGMGEESVLGPLMPVMQRELMLVIGRPGMMEPMREILDRYGNRIIDTMMNAAYSNTINTDKNGKVKRVVDKMLFNYRNIGFIHLVFPNAVIIHTIRDPLDTLLSCYKHKFGDQDLEWSLDPEHLVFEYVQYLEIMHHFRTVLPGRVTDVSYEEMVRDPEKVIRGVIGKLGLDWDPNVMQFHKTNRTVQTVSMSQVRHSVYSKSVGGWRKYASHMKPFIEAFNKFIPQLEEKGALPFPDVMNWKFDVNFDYGFGPMEITATTVATNTSNDVSSSSESEDMKLSKNTSKNSKDKSNKNKNKTSNKKKNKKNKKNKINKGKKKTTKDKKNKNNNKNKKNSSGTKGLSKDRQALLLLLESLEGVVDTSLVRQIMHMLSSSSSGDDTIDEIIAIGYGLISSRKFSQAISVFESLQGIRSDVSVMDLPYGIALAMSGKLEEALVAFDKLVAMEPEVAEGYARRAEVLTALGRKELALADLNRLVEGRMGESSVQYSAYMGRGQLHYQASRFRSAYRDYREALSLVSEGDKVEETRVLHLVGKCERALGLTDQAIATLLQARETNPSMHEVELELAICYMELSRWKEALPHVQRAIDMFPRYKMAYGYRGLMYHNLGRSQDALVDFRKAIDLEPNEPSGMLLAASCLHALGKLTEAAAMYDRMLSLSPSHDCWFSREISYFYYVNLDVDVSSFNADHRGGVEQKVKEGVSRHLPWTNLFPLGYVSPLAVAARDKMEREGDKPVAMTDTIRALLGVTSPIAKWVQLETPGFMPNERQHRQFGLSALQMAQSLRQHARSLRAVGGEGLLVPDSASSSVSWFGFTPSSKSNHHVFGWRDMFDIAVRWRQISEPLDAVWWNDCLQIDAGKDQLGLKTNMQAGWSKIVRYNSYLPMGMNVTKSLLLTQSQWSASDVSAISSAQTVEELFHATGDKSFFVTTACHSISEPGTAMEGTRITLQVSEAEGLDFLINCLVDTDRDKTYAKEMDFTFRRFVTALGDVMDISDTDSSRDTDRYRKASDEAFDRALEMFFYWVNYAPLSRGTSATGYAALMACVVAMGEEILAPVPKGKQLDWEGLFTSHPSEFVDRIRGWLDQRSVSKVPKEWLDSSAPGHDLKDVFRTTRAMMAAIGALQ